MKLDRTFTGLLFVALLGGFVGTAGCTAYPTYKKNVSIECDVETQYQLDVPTAFLFDTVSPPDPGWTSADGSPGASMTGVVKAIPDGSRCGSTAALVLTAEKNNDWGSLFGFNNFRGPLDDGIAYEGMSFWARVTDYNSNTAFTILLDDPNTSNPNAVANCAADAGAPPIPTDGGSSCRNYCSDGGTATGNTDPGTGMIIPGSVSVAPEPDQCGNSFTVVRTVTTWWRFYTIPFSEFQQGAMPNRVPNAALNQTGPSGTPLRTSQLLNLVFRMPKAMRTELWIDNLGFYRKPTAAGGDGGADAPRM